MKFRCVTNHIRFRLGKSDIEVFKTAGMVSTSLDFGNHVRFCYRLSTTSDNEPSVDFSNNCLTVAIPSHQVLSWTDDEEKVSIGFRHTSGPDIFLDVLIEKDFPCKHGTAKDNQDTFHELID